ncbi:sigma-54 interaction domain-containing protein [Methylomicrobium lacus]|uniref:sigma-54 interaction domain-containing protein n=1 Tax=Methylomicrobium lacus TaxID=136992 RepID=UPI00045EB057|nr:sigma 54-interacting transcriptional regulator [Methylomicrobium lacus]
MKNRLLFSWIGNTDIREAANRERLGPLVSILVASRFDVLYLIYDKPETEITSFIRHIEERVDITIIKNPVSLSDPTHFGDIYRAFDSMLNEAQKAYPNAELIIQITSGTPAMTAVSILLGKAKYSTKFVQSSIEQGVSEPDIPFDIFADFLPALAKKTDAKFSSLFSGQTPNSAAFADILTQSDIMETLKQKAAIIAQRDVPVLIYGETGTGKELFAKAIHNASRRADKPLLTLNCGAIPKDLIDTTLFGHTKGAFTGAHESRKGYFEQAERGTLFLDEFGELPLESQVRLLRVIQQGTFTLVGSTTEKLADVRIIAATNRNLIDDIAEGKFREDLFYRVAIGMITLPPLRERKGDLPLLAKKLLEKVNLDASDAPGYIHKKLSANAIKFISNYSWPGNVRELQATILRASLWQQGELLSEEDIRDALLETRPARDGILWRDISQGIDIDEIIKEVSVHYIERAIKENQGNKSKAAAMLGLKNYQTLNNWIEKYNVK